jgi:hypothetical protein
MKMLLLVLILVLLVGWLFLRSRQENVPVARKTTRRVTSTKKNYHAVSIKFEAYACAAAKELEGQRFLSNAAPRLPLPECNVTDCKCHFAHHKDRRAGKDRRNVFTASGYSAETGKHEQERRQADDRRHDDDDDFIY